MSTTPPADATAAPSVTHWYRYWHDGVANGRPVGCCTSCTLPSAKYAADADSISGV
jgi:hypothetical protein